MIKKNILFLGPALENINIFDYEKRIATIIDNYADYSFYDKVIDLGLAYFNEDKNFSSKQICDLIMNQIDENTIAIVDTYYLYCSFFSQYEELYSAFKKQLKKTDNKDIKFFIARFMHGTKRIEYSMDLEKKLKKLLGNRVYSISLDLKILNKMSQEEMTKIYMNFIANNLKN